MVSTDMLTGLVVGAIISGALVAVFVAVPFDNGDDDGGTPPLVTAINGHSNGQDPETLSIPVSTHGEYVEPTMSFADIYEKVNPGVVKIMVERYEIIDTNDGGVGSGFVYDMEGHIVTNAHVIRAAESITVTFSDSSLYNAEIVGKDEFADIAVLKVDVDEPSKLQTVPLGDSSTLRVGEPVAAIGNPFGLTSSMSTGIISQVERLLPTNTGYSLPDVIQTDTAINPGSSGGPLLNLKGEIVGVNNAIQSTSGEYAGVGFAISARTVEKLAPALIEDGEYAHPWIGISGRNIEPETVKLMNLNITSGFLIIDVIPDSPADAAGLMPSEDYAVIEGEDRPIGGDVMLGVDGVEVNTINDILLYLHHSKSAGDTIEVELLRDGAIVKVYVTLAERPD